MSLSTIFPAVPKTVWRPGDPEIECLLGFMEGDALFINGRTGLAMRGPSISLDSGLYGVEFQLGLNRDDLPADRVIAQAQVTAGSGAIVLAASVITAGQLAANFGGMYQGVRLDVIVERPVTDVEFRVVSSGASLFQVRGVKLVPRPGRIWFPRDMECEDGEWRFNADRSATSAGAARISTPIINLSAGEHRLGVKLRPPDAITSGMIAAIQITGTPFSAGEDTASEVIAADSAVTAQAMLANHGVPDAKLRFLLAEPNRDIGVLVTALEPGLTLQWVRLATADEAVWHHYYNLGGTSSALGHPTGGFATVGRSPRGLQGSRRTFEGGSIYWTIEHGPCEVSGEIEAQYEARGGFLGELGFPAVRPKVAGDEITQQFEGGLLTAKR